MRPKAIAVIGVSQREARGNRVIRNLVDLGFDGGIYPINPKYPEVLGLPCYPDLGSTPEVADCVVVAIPAQHVPDVLETAVEVGVRAAVVLSSGFAEAGPEGRSLQVRLERLSQERGLLICGPNCFGLVNVATRAAAFSGPLPSPLLAGNVALVSQSGGLSNVVVPPLVTTRGVGFSYVVSCGNQAGVTIEEFLDYLVEDNATEVIAAFVEGFKRPRELLAVADKALARHKPIVVLKVGRSEVAIRAAMTHTGSLAGGAEVAEAAFRQHGIIQVRSLSELVETLALFSCQSVRQRSSAGVRIGVLTGTGGETGYLGDVADAVGVELPMPAESTVHELASVLPSFAGATNPLDGTGQMFDDPQLFPRLLRSLLEDPGLDVVAVNLDHARVPKPGVPSPPREFARAMVGLAPGAGKPLVAFTSRAGDALDPEVILPLRQVGVAVLDGTEFALAACRNLGRYQGFLETLRSGRNAPVSPLVETSVPGLPEGVLDTGSAFHLLRTFGIPVAATELARTAAEAVEIAARLGLPVAMKVESPSIQHKSDVGGVMLGVHTPAAVRDAFHRIRAEVAARSPDADVTGVLVQPMAADGLEMLLGVKRDPVFGPAVVCGLGGIFVEVLRDVAVGLPPLSRQQALELLQGLRGWPLLAGARGRQPADVPALCDAIVAVSGLAAALGDRIEALDINPLLVYPRGDGVLAVDALLQLS